MARKNFIARCDDLGSSKSANMAINAVTQAGFFKNVSVMAPGPAVEEAAEIMAERKDICFGMHTALNAEWDKVKWGPVLPLDEKSGLVDTNGAFLSDPAQFETTRPAVEVIMQEAEAQLEKLHILGFDISYIDTHMFPEMYVEGLDEAMAAFARKKGLIDHMYFYNLPPGFRDLRVGLDEISNIIKNMPDGQYFFISHPAYDTEEMRLTGNVRVSGEDVAKGRGFEAKIFSDPEVSEMMKLIGCEGIRYDEAIPEKRMTIDDLKIFL